MVKANQPNDILTSDGLTNQRRTMILHIYACQLAFYAWQKDPNCRITSKHCVFEWNGLLPLCMINFNAIFMGPFCALLWNSSEHNCSGCVCVELWAHMLTCISNGLSFIVFVARRFSVAIKYQSNRIFMTLPIRTHSGAFEMQSISIWTVQLNNKRMRSFNRSLLINGKAIKRQHTLKFPFDRHGES